MKNVYRSVLTAFALPRWLLQIALVTCLGFGAPSARAGIPVVDIGNLIQSIAEVLNSITQIENQISQIEQYGKQLNSLNGVRGLGALLRNPMFANYIPSNVTTLVDSVDRSGYGGLTGAAKALRDVDMVYNCADKTGDARTSCQSSLARPYQTKAVLQRAMDTAGGRLAQISGLIDNINATSDQKSIQELQARIAGENAMLAHEVSQIQIMAGIADNEERVAGSKRREAAADNLSRRSRLGTLLPP
jgi:type IV secretion system protein VirB5